MDHSSSSQQHSSYVEKGHEEEAAQRQQARDSGRQRGIEEEIVGPNIFFFKDTATTEKVFLENADSLVPVRQSRVIAGFRYSLRENATFFPQSAIGKICVGENT